MDIPRIHHVTAICGDPQRNVDFYASAEPRRDRDAKIKAHEVDMTDINGVRKTSGEALDLKLEVVVLPVSDVDRARGFYKGLGWRLDADIVRGEDFRVMQLTPPGSACSMIFGTGITSAAPGSADSLILVVKDLEAARAQLIRRGAGVSEVFRDVGGVFHHAGTEGPRARPGSGRSLPRLVRLVQRSRRPSPPRGSVAAFAAAMGLGARPAAGRLSEA